MSDTGGHRTSADIYEGWIGRVAIDRDGNKIGTITDISYNETSGEPEWIGVRNGVLVNHFSFVPVYGAESDGEHLCLPVDKARVKEAPAIDNDRALTPEDEHTLHEYYDRGQVGDALATDRDVGLDLDVTAG